MDSIVLKLHAAISETFPWGVHVADWLLPAPTSKHDHGMKRSVIPIALGLTYIWVIFTLGGGRVDHVILGLLPLLDYYNKRTRLFFRSFMPFVCTGIIFDSMRYYYWAGVKGHIHVDEVYFRDLNWFGINVGAEGASVAPPGMIQAGLAAAASTVTSEVSRVAQHQIVTPNEYFQLHHWIAADVACGLAYLVFIFESLFTAIYLFTRRHMSLLWAFGWCWYFVNFFGYATYFIYPAAPPWYVSEYGLGPARMDVRPESAAAQRFDQLFHTHAFSGMYGRGIDVYGAYPSLHVSYPFLVMWVTFMLRELRWARVPAVIFYLLMCFSAVYLQHHFVVDIIMGSLYAAVLAGVATYWLRVRRGTIPAWITRHR